MSGMPVKRAARGTSFSPPSAAGAAPAAPCRAARSARAPGTSRTCRRRRRSAPESAMWCRTHRGFIARADRSCLSISTNASYRGCELVLFMLMLPCGCEGHHARGLGRLHILPSLPHWSESVLSKHAALASAPSSTSSADTTDPAVSRFLDAVWMERGLSANTLAAYRADLDRAVALAAPNAACRS